jgi:vancomycin resistance protein VanJ
VADPAATEPPTADPAAGAPTHAPTDATTGPTRGGAVPARQPARTKPHRRGNILTLVVLALIVALVGHRFVPAAGGIGLVWESLLPWTIALFALAALGAILRRSARAGLWVFIGLAVWSVMFVPLLLTHRPAASAATPLTVASQNVNAANTDAGAAARALVATKADVVAVEELGNASEAPARSVLDAAYTHSTTASTVGVWSRYPLTDVTRLDLGMAWDRTLHVTLQAPAGDVSLYVVHLPSVRPGVEAGRNRALAALAAAVRADASPRIVVVGDFNAATFDRNMRPLLAEVADSRRAAGGGLGSTWPARVPLTRPDHVLSKGFTVVSDDVLAAHGSDHRAIMATLRATST